MIWRSNIQLVRPTAGKKQLVVVKSVRKEFYWLFLLCFIFTQDGDDLVVLDDLQRPRHDEAQRVHALAGVEDEVAGGAVGGLELHRQRAQAAVAGEPEGGMLVEHLRGRRMKRGSERHPAGV